MKNRTLRLWLACCAVIVFGSVLRVCSYVAKENGMDGFYHMRIARQGWSVYASKVFPATTLSSWEECFADKELLYHILLSGVDKMRAFLALPEFPFHFDALLFFALLCVTFALCAKALDLRHPEYPTLLFTILTSVFFPRMLMLRPHVFSLTLMLFSCIVYARCPRKILLWGSFLCGMLFAWGYSNPHFVFLAAGGFAFGFFWSERQRTWRLLGGTVLGLAAGFILHPQFPNNCINWYIVCMVVPAVMSGQIGGVILGAEALYSGIAAWRGLWPLFSLQLFCLGLMLYLFFRNRKKLFEPEMLAIGSICLVSGAGLLGAFRMVEYAQPFAVLCFAMLVERALPEKVWWRRGQCIVYLLLALLCGVCCWQSYYPGRLNVRPTEGLAAFVKARKIPAGTIIANHEWDMFPALYYSLPEYRFLCGLDPCFALVVAPHRTAKLELQRWGFEFFAPADFADIIRARLLYVRSTKLAQKLVENGYGPYLIYQGKDGYLFHLPQHNRKDGK